jgi:hypothetical protein
VYDAAAAVIIIIIVVKKKVKVELSHYTPWRHMGGEEV